MLGIICRGNVLLKQIREVVKAVPDVKPYLSGKARFALYVPEHFKTLEFMLGQIRRLVTSLYNNQIGGDFIDIMANIISGQLRDAYIQAWNEYGETGELPDYLQSAYEADVLAQYDHVDGFFRDIIDARIDGKPIDPLIARVDLWANRWTESYNNAIRLIQVENGGNLEWVYGDTDHCETCMNLNGIVMSAREWDTLGVKPQSAPNNKLECGGWKCQCRLEPTGKRRSPGAYGRVEEIII